MKNDAKVWDWRGYILKYAPKNSTYRHLLLTLSCYMNSAGGSCFPSITELEKATALTRPTVVKYLKKANKDGWIKTTKQKAENSEWQRNTYTADIPDKVVKEIYQVVNEVNQGSKAGLQGVVKEVNSISPVYNSPNNSLVEDDDSGTISVQGKRFKEGEKIINVLDQVDISLKPQTEKEKYSLMALYIWRDINSLRPNNKITLKAKLKAWVDPIRLMISEDGRDIREVWDLWLAVKADPFWKKNVLSTEKLREKYDQLSIKLQSTSGDMDDFIDSLYQ